MSIFASWIETEKAIFFLTGNQILRTRRGRELRDYVKSVDDYVGHGAIRWFYGFGDDIGCTKQSAEFIDPTKFPDEMVQSIKNGEMKGLVLLTMLLAIPALDEYRKIVRKAWAQYGQFNSWNDYNNTRQDAFWNLFQVSTNRIISWR